MSDNNQPAAERARLDAAWQAHPQVAAQRDALLAFARENHLRFDAASMSKLAAFRARWEAQHGFLPDCGIVVG